MQSTFENGLGVAFKGKGITPGIPGYVANGGIRTVGGIISKDNTNKAKFGLALFAEQDKPSEFRVGSDGLTTALFRGILLNRPMVNEQFPGHADWVFNGSPADAIYQGSVWVEIEGEVKVGAKVYAKEDGTLSVSSAPNLSVNATVKEYDPDTGLYLIYLDGNDGK